MHFYNMLKANCCGFRPKKDDLTNGADYRLTSLLSVVGRIFERLLNDQIWKHLETYKLLSDVQFGFRH